MGEDQDGYTTIHRRRWITISSWSLRTPDGPQHCVEVIRCEGRGRYGILWARGNELRVRDGMDRKDADAMALKIREKYAPVGEWLDTSVR